MKYKEFIKTKNIIDMQYQKLISYFQIVTISALSAIIGLLLAYFTQQINAQSVSVGVLLAVLFCFFIDFKILLKINQTKKELTDLS